MEDFSLYVLDITMNSVRAKADAVSVEISESGDWLDFTVTDNGCGMSAEQVAKLRDPFFTTRTTRKVGLGIPFFTMLAEMTGGFVEIRSTPESESDDHGTVIHGRFGRNHIDFVPLGDVVSTGVTLIQGSPDVNFTFTHTTEKGSVHLSCAELRAVLGEDIPLSEPEILMWIDGSLREQYQLFE
jgi:signal transduction histidine kinase